MLKTLVTMLRKNAAGNWTAEKMATEMSRRGKPRAVSTVTAFERAQFKDPDPELVELYGAILGIADSVVWDAYRKTQRQRKRASGPFVAPSSHRRRRSLQRKRIVKKLLTRAGPGR